MWKIRKCQVQGTQRFWEDVDQIVKVSLTRSSLSGAPGPCADHEGWYVHHCLHVPVWIYHPWDAVLLRCRMLRACRYIDEVLCTRGCERRLSHLSGSRDSVHFLRIDAEWSLDDAMLVHAFRFLQKIVHAQRTFQEGSTAAPFVSGDLNDFVTPLALLYHSLLHHAASCHLDFARWLCLRYLVCMPHRARGPGHRNTP